MTPEEKVERKRKKQREHEEMVDARFGFSEQKARKSLFEEEEESPRDLYKVLRMDTLVPSKELQTRHHISEAGVAELAESIRLGGMNDPILVRPFHGEIGKYEIVSGERRYRAMQLLGRVTVQCIIRIYPDDASALTSAIAGNLVRKNLNALETAISLKATLESREGSTMAEVGSMYGMSKTSVSEALSLLRLRKLDHEMFEAALNLPAERATTSYLSELVRIPTKEGRAKAWEVISEGEPTTQALRRIRVASEVAESGDGRGLRPFRWTRRLPSGESWEYEVVVMARKRHRVAESEIKNVLRAAIAETGDGESKR